MSWIWPIIAFAVIALWVYAWIDIIRRRHTMSGGKIAAWVLVILIFPVLGAIVYFLARGAGPGEPVPREPVP
ncbi:MAG TPA: PLD nuclease N-terminal domain-containing protein [Gaiellaceae bacterium]|jgi:hypothetical protein|nr:PLD nuclease N-terminal domain-containing protein [Gaiellaceae bacterium]